MQFAIDRRALMAGAAAVPVAALPALPALAAGTDAELIGLGRQFDRLARELNDAFHSEKGLYSHKKIHSPPMPDAAKFREGDEELGFSRSWADEEGYYSAPSFGRLKYHPRTRDSYTPVRFENGQSIPTGPTVFAPPADLGRGPEYLVRITPWPEAQTRAEEIMAGMEAFWDDCRELDEASGYTAATKRINDLYDRLHELTPKIIDKPAYTLAGMQVKARVVFWAAVGEIHASEPETTHDKAAVSIVRDLMRMHGVEPMTDDEYEASCPFPIVA